MPLSPEERERRQDAQQLLRSATEILKRAGISQNEIAKEAKYSSGYLPQLLNSPGERLTPAALTRVASAMEIVASRAIFRLDELSRVELRQALDRLKVGYGESRLDIVGPGQPVTPRIANYLHRRIDHLLMQEVTSHAETDDLRVIGLAGPPGAGKTWAIQRMTQAGARETHDICLVDFAFADLEAVDPGSEGERVLRFMLNGLLQHLRRLQKRSSSGELDPAPNDPAAPIRPERVAQALVELVMASPDCPRLMVIIDGPDRAGDSARLVRLLRHIETDRWDYPELRRVLIVVVGTFINSMTEAMVSGLRPLYKLEYLADDEAKALFEMWRAAGGLRNIKWKDIEPDVRFMGGHPRLLSQLFESCRVRGSQVHASKVLEPGSEGWQVLRSQFGRFADACASRAHNAAELLETWLLQGSITATDADYLPLKELVKQFGLVTSEDEWVPYLAFKDGQCDDLRRLLLQSVKAAALNSATKG